jgi:hypothetical protein
MPFHFYRRIEPFPGVRVNVSKPASARPSAGAARGSRWSRVERELDHRKHGG